LKNYENAKTIFDTECTANLFNFTKILFEIDVQFIKSVLLITKTLFTEVYE